jgi:hypothetical protein
MEKVSEVKSAADEAKGAVLEQISRTVEDINAAIGEKKGRLAPQIKALREARAQLQVCASVGRRPAAAGWTDAGCLGWPLLQTFLRAGSTAEGLFKVAPPC